MTENCFKKFLGGLVFLAVLGIDSTPLAYHHLTSDTIVSAAVLPTDTINPNHSLDTGNHILDSSYVQDTTNWETITNKDSTAWDISGNKMFWLIDNKPDTVAYQISKTGLDFSKPISIEIPWFYNNFLDTDSWKVGDGAGYLFTPATFSNIEDNLPNLTLGGYLGVQGLKNTVYVGRDLFYNTLLDCGGSISGGTSRIQIRRTSASGNLEYSSNSSSPLPWVETIAPGSWDSNSGSAWYSEKIAMRWSNIVDNGNGTYTGEITLTTKRSSYSDTTITRRVTLQRNMNFGALAVTGSNHGVIQEGQATTNSSFSGSRATDKVMVNFVNEKTGKMIDTAPSSTITVNLGDIIGVAKSGANPNDDYTYTAPTITGYYFSKANSVRVVNYMDGGISPNIINVQYTPKKINANFKWQYVGTDTAPILPATIVQTGDVDDKFSEPQLPALPYGYEIQDVVAPDGQTYSDIKTALASGNNGLYPKSGTADFTIRVKMTAPLVPSLDSVPDFEATSLSIQAEKGIYPITSSQKGKLQVSDERASRNGWQLTAAMSQPFTSDASIPEYKAPIGVYLKGEFLTFKPKTPVTTTGNTFTPPHTADFQLTNDSAQAIVMSAGVNEGGGQWELPFTEITLHTLDSDIKASVTYKGTITWTLSDVP